MILYRGGKTIKDLSELTDGEMYCVGGIGGVLEKVMYESGPALYRFTARKEMSMLFLSAEALEGRIKLGLVKRVLAEGKATGKTLAKITKK